MKNVYFIFILLGLSAGHVEAQSLKQVIRGRVIDLDSKSPLIGVTLFIEGSQPIIGTITDNAGYFEFREIPIGRYNIGISYLGYKDRIIPNLLLVAGKEAYLNVELEESVEHLDEVVVAARKHKGEAMNDMATVSARSISVEETQRFAGSFNDPSRLVSSYAGVMGDPDGNNNILVRGNSPRGIQWRLEGVDVPNPNHFANEGATGGPISILNNTTLGNCDFFTGAFPADYGDAYSGVFDVHLRKGNNKNGEYAIQVGVIGADLTAEGPVAGTQASYLVNYRYSSLDLLTRAGIKVVGDAVPKFQDMTLNVYIPSARAGSFQIFGIGGLSTISFEEESWKENFDADLGIIGINHIYAFSNKTYLKTSLSFTGTRNKWNSYEAVVEPDGWEQMGLDRFEYVTYALGTHLTHKLSARHTVKAGITGKIQGYDLTMDVYDWDNDVLFRSVGEDGSTELVSGYVNWKYRPFDALTINTGVHSKYFNLNGNYTVEPRIGVRWEINQRNAVTAGFGMHSKTDNVSIYLFGERAEDNTVVQQNKELGFLKARHYVLGYENRIGRNLSFKIETYYQDLYDVPVSEAEGSTFSILNVEHGYLTMPMVNEGSARNYGAEISLEKYFSNNYYFLITGSLFESKYTALDGVERKARFSNNYITNVVAGKEFPIGKKKNSAISVNIRGSYAGGQWYTAIDEEASRDAGYTIRDYGNAYSKRRPDYTRFDLKLGFRRNKKQTTRVWEIDIQNVTNTLNITGDYWDRTEDKVITYTQLGILPVLNYRIEF